MAVRIAAFAIVSALTLDAQQEPPSFRSEATYVEIDARVTDRDGALVKDLTKEDFELLEDGQPQAIADFRFIDLPIEPPRRDAPVLESDVVTNGTNRRAYVMLLESMVEMDRNLADVRRTQNVAHQFVDEALGPDDVMAVIHPQGSMSHAQAFTNHKSLLHASIDQLPRSVMMEAQNPCAITRLRNTYRAIEDVSLRLGAMSGQRKAIIWIGGRIPFDAQADCWPPLSGARVASIAFMHRDALRAATRHNVAIYPIDPMGPQPGGQGASLNVLSLPQVGALRSVAEDTGGLAVVGTSRFSPAFEQIVRDNSSYYLFGYYATRDWRDGRFHPITVRVTRPGLSVRARPGYYAPETEPTGSLAVPGAANGAGAATQALRSPLPVNGLTLQAFATPFQGTAGRTWVLIGALLRGADLTRDAEDRIEFASLTIDTKGTVSPGAQQVFTLNLRDETRAAVSAGGFQYLEAIDVPPGRHEIRLVAHQPGGDTGSIVTHVDVPEFSDEPLTLSGILLTSPATTVDRTLEGDAPLAELFPNPPTARRRFARTDTVAAYVEVYAEDRIRPDEIRLTATLMTARQSRLRQDAGTRLPNGDGRTGYTVTLPLDGLEPGEHIWRLEARAGRRTASREILFAVE